MRCRHSLVLSQELNPSVSQVPSNRKGSAQSCPMRVAISEVRAVPWAHTHSGNSQKARSRIHRYGRAADRAQRTAPDGGGTVFVALGCALCRLSFFSGAIPSCAARSRCNGARLQNAGRLPPCFHHPEHNQLPACGKSNEHLMLLILTEFHP